MAFDVICFVLFLASGWFSLHVFRGDFVLGHCYVFFWCSSKFVFSGTSYANFWLLGIIFQPMALSLGFVFLVSLGVLCLSSDDS